MRPRGFLFLVAALAATAFLRIAIGPVADGSATRLAVAVPSAEILALRAMSVLSAATVGVALGLSGLALQTLLRNPLASPFVLGISSGAGFGVSVLLVAGYLFGSAIAFPGEAVGAVLGSALALAIVSRFGRTGEGHDPTTLVLAGVIMAAIFGAGTTLCEQLVPFGLRGDLTSWMAGRLPEIPDARELGAVGALTALALLMLLSSARALDVSMLSDDEARSSGVHLAALRGRLFWIGGILAGIAVAYAGPIGFVGLVAPHLARRLVGPHHRSLVPAAALAGAALLVAADAVRQVLDVGTGRLPVGVLTALAGGPVFLWLLRRRAWSL